MARKRASPAVYIVQKVAWTEMDDSFFCCPCQGGYEGWPVRAFRSAARAEEFRTNEERAARQVSNPFDHGEEVWELNERCESWLDLSARLDRLDLNPPDSSAIEDWRIWWARADLTEEQAEAVWKALDQVRFYEVVEVGLAGRVRKERALEVVHEVSWVEPNSPDDTFSRADPAPEEAGLVAGVYPGRAFKAFTERELAEACQQEQESARRAGRNPFAHGDSFDEVSSAEEPLFHDLVLDLGLEPPKADRQGRRDWRGWWEAASPGLTAEQIAAVWRQMDRVRFFQVVEVPWED